MSWRCTGLVFIMAFATSASAQDASSLSTQAYAGQWMASSDAPSDSGGGMPAAAGPSGNGRGGMHGGGRGGMGGGAGGMSGGPNGKGGGRHSPHDHAPPAGNPGGAVNEPESADRALERLFAQQVTITALDHPHRLRFDTGTHAVDLSTDGGNVSGPGVGGTVALTIDKDALVVDGLSDSGYVVKERYTVADDGRRLELHATLKKGDGPEREIVRVFSHPVAKAPIAAH
jgi:hypothetical protein